MKNDKQETLVELGNKVVGQIELPSIDVSQYVGKKVKIEKIEEHEGNYGFYVKMQTELVAELDAKNKDGEHIKLYGSRIFGLQEDADGNIGWGEKTKLGLFLKKKGVAHYKDLIGKEVVITSITNDEGKDYLSFN